MRTSLLKILCLTAFAAALFCGCEKEGGEGQDGYDKVLILYSAGFNSLSSYLAQDIEDLQKGWLPAKKSREALLVISRQPEYSGDYNDRTAPFLFRIYKGKKGPVLDTLYSMEKGESLASAANLRTFLSKAAELFPSKSYGLILSSHATGWMPSFYFSNPERYDAPRIRSVTQEVYIDNGRRESMEIDIPDFAAAVPMHFDYMIFDACLMGGVEVAWELRNVTGRIGFCQTETLAEGFDYRNITERLLNSTPADPEQACRDFFESYDSRSGNYRSATVSYVDCGSMDELAQICRTLFGKYREKLTIMDGDNVQGYFYDASKHWHYDLYDIIEKAGADAGELAELKAALEKCVLYKAATPYFFNLQIKSHCGLSMYLPSMGGKYLDEFYKTLEWNKATELVR